MQGTCDVFVDKAITVNQQIMAIKTKIEIIEEIDEIQVKLFARKILKNYKTFLTVRLSSVEYISSFQLRATL